MGKNFLSYAKYFIVPAMQHGRRAKPVLLVFSVTPYQDKNKSRSIDKVQNLEKESW